MATFRRVPSTTVGTALAAIRIVIELVWDSARRGTATTCTGTTLAVGEDVGWSPENLLALSAATCVMRTFLQLAADEGVPVLGYVAAARVDPGDVSTGTVRVTSCVVVPAGVLAEHVADLCSRTAAASPVASMLGDRLHHVSEISRIDDEPEE
jgi:organic hydroperoxide reductase OsmC/OhrA